MPRSAARRHNRYPENTCTEEPTTTKALASSTAIKAASLSRARDSRQKKRQALGSHRIGRSRYLKLLNPLIPHRNVTIRARVVNLLSLIDPIEHFYCVLDMAPLVPMATGGAENGFDGSMQVQH